MVHKHGKWNGWYAYKVQTSIEMQCDIMKRFHFVYYTWREKYLKEQCLGFSALWWIHWRRRATGNMHGLKVKLFVKFIIAFSQHKIVSTLHRCILFVIAWNRNVNTRTRRAKSDKHGIIFIVTFNWVIQCGWIWSYLWPFFIPFELTN